MPSKEGRLAALNDDREGAILAYHRYLPLRSEAEPRLRPQLAQGRAESRGPRAREHGQMR